MGGDGGVHGLPEDSTEHLWKQESGLVAGAKVSSCGAVMFSVSDLLCLLLTSVSPSRSRSTRRSSHWIGMKGCLSTFSLPFHSLCRMANIVVSEVGLNSGINCKLYVQTGKNSCS